MFRPQRAIFRARAAQGQRMQSAMSSAAGAAAFGMGVADSAGGGGSDGGMMNLLYLASMAGRFTPMAMVASVGVGLGNKYFDGLEQDAQSQDRIAAEKSAADREMKRAGRSGAGTQDYKNMAEEAEEALTQIKEKRPALERAAEPAWYSPLHWTNKLGWTHQQTGEGRRALAENDAAAEIEQKKAEKFREEQKKSFANIEARDIAAKEKFATGDLRGMRDATRDANWMREYNRLVAAGAEEWQAQEGANAQLGAEKAAENLKFGRLVNARSGAGDIARAATLASGRMDGHHHGNDAIVSNLEALHQTMQKQHTEAIGSYTRRVWSR